MKSSVHLTRLKGFTLIEVLLALSIIAIALTALLRSTTQTIDNTQRIKEKSISHWVAVQGLSMIQLNLVQLGLQDATQVTKLLGQRIYWRAETQPTGIKSVQKVTISVSSSQRGPFRKELTGFRITR